MPAGKPIFCIIPVTAVAAMLYCLGIGGLASNSSWIALTTCARLDVEGFQLRRAGPMYSIVAASRDLCVTLDIM